MGNFFGSIVVALASWINERKKHMMERGHWFLDKQFDAGEKLAYLASESFGKACDWCDSGNDGDKQKFAEAHAAFRDYSNSREWLLESSVNDAASRFFRAAEDALEKRLYRDRCKAIQEMALRHKELGACVAAMVEKDKLKRIAM